MIYLGIIFTNINRSKLDNTKPIFEVEEKVNKIEGKITSILNKKEDSVVVLVENVEKGNEIDRLKLNVKVDETTIIKENKLCKIQDLEVGDKVIVTFDNIEEQETLAKKIEIK